MLVMVSSHGVCPQVATGGENPKAGSDGGGYRDAAAHDPQRIDGNRSKCEREGGRFSDVWGMDEGGRATNPSASKGKKGVRTLRCGLFDGRSFWGLGDRKSTRLNSSNILL